MSLVILGPRTCLSKSKNTIPLLSCCQFILTTNINVCGKSNSSTFYCLESRRRLPPLFLNLFKVNNRYQKDVMEVVLAVSLLTLNYFTPFPSFPIGDFEQVNSCWENYLTFYSFDICFNVSIVGRQDLARSNAGNSFISLISHNQWDVTLASLQLLKSFTQGTLESLYKCNHQILKGTKIKQEIAMNLLPRIIFHFRKR